MKIKTKSSLLETPAKDVLEKLYTAASQQRHGPRPANAESMTIFERYYSARHRYMPIDRSFGQLMYSLIRASKVQTVVEFGTSFGISTLFLAAGVRDNGSGRVVTTEFIPEKAATAKQNLTNAGLAEYVDFRVGDAMETLREPLPGLVDFVFLDGDKSMYPLVLRLLEPMMKPGCLIASDNTDHDEIEVFLDYLRNPANGYISMPVLTPGRVEGTCAHEISLRL